MRRSPGRALISLVVGLSLAACGESANPATTSTTAPVTTTTSLATTTTEAVPIPDVQTEIDWFVGLLNGGELTSAEYEQRFTEDFRGQVPFEEGFLPVLDQYRPAGPWTVVERSGQGSQGEAVVESTDGSRARILAELDDQARFAGLVVQSADIPTLDDPPDSVAEAWQRLSEMGTVRALTAEIVDDRCVPIEQIAPDEPAPIGSVFKLYVLAALGKAIQAGEISWDDEITIRDELKSIPSGVLQDRPAGETVTVGEAAELMISISDNTATDHLIDLLGRETVEAVLSEYGNITPELNIPLLDTREMTALKIGPAEGLRVQWLDGDEAARRAILAQISDITPADLPLQEWVDPVDPDRLEWFASPSDLCTLAVRLSALAADVPEIATILSMNPGAPAEPGTWESIWFKGGGEPGLLAVWFVTEVDGRRFVTTGSVVDPETALDPDESVLLFAAARDLIAP